MQSGNNDDRARLQDKARQRAFSTYLRYGRMTEQGAAQAGQKALSPQQALPPSNTLPRPTRHYMWHTAGDDRVRSAHALNQGRIFAWDAPPPGGHPGSEPNCRCWPVPHFGDPAIPDNLQPLQHAYQVDTSGTAGWTSIETLTRPDGSLAESVVMLADGTQVRSRFWRTLIARTVTLATGGKVRIDTDAGVQTVYLDDDEVPLFQSRWTVKGPVVTRARQRVAFLLDRDPINGILNPRRPELNGAGGGGSGLGAAAIGLTSVYAAQQAAPASQGLGAGDEPVLALKAWTVDANRQPVPILVDSLTEEQLRQHCQYLPDVQQWTDVAALALQAQRASLTPQKWGTRVHLAVKSSVDALTSVSPIARRILRAELSMTETSPQVSYGTRGSTRLDIFEDRTADLGAVCVYDVKTGAGGITPDQLRRIADVIKANYQTSIFYIIEIRPTQ